jgi:hypothetical protein
MNTVSHRGKAPRIAPSRQRQRRFLLRLWKKGGSLVCLAWQQDLSRGPSRFKSVGFLLWRYWSLKLAGFYLLDECRYVCGPKDSSRAELARVQMTLLYCFVQLCSANRQYFRELVNGVPNALKIVLFHLGMIRACSSAPGMVAADGAISLCLACRCYEGRGGQRAWTPADV